MRSRSYRVKRGGGQESGLRREHRDWRIFAYLAAHLIVKARRLYAGDTTGLEIEQMVYALDSSTIDLCLTLFPWAKFRRTKSAIKLHSAVVRRKTTSSGSRSDSAISASERNVDKLHVGGIPLQRGSTKLHAAALPHLIALKLHAIRNNPAREAGDLGDIARLLRANPGALSARELAALCTQVGPSGIETKLQTLHIAP